jgi:lipocalin
MKRIFLLLSIFPLFALTGCMSQPDYRAETSPPETVSTVDLSQYAGLWYEIARYPNGFQQDCEGVTAEYVQRADGKITVINTCRSGDGRCACCRGFGEFKAESTVCAGMGAVCVWRLLDSAFGAGLLGRLGGCTIG